MLNCLEYSELSILQIDQTRSRTQVSLCTLLFLWGFLPSVSVLHLFLSCSNFTFLCGDSCTGSIGANIFCKIVFICDGGQNSFAISWFITFGTSFDLGLSPVPTFGTSFVLGLSPVPTLGTSFVLGLSPVPTLGTSFVLGLSLSPPWAPPSFWVCPPSPHWKDTGFVGGWFRGLFVSLDRCSRGGYNFGRQQWGLFCFHQGGSLFSQRNSWHDLVKNCLWMCEALFLGHFSVCSLDLLYTLVVLSVYLHRRILVGQQGLIWTL